MAEPTLRSVRSRLDLRWLVAGVLALCVGGLGAALLYANASSATPVITIKRTVYRDQIITTEDLGVISLAVPIGLDAVGADRLAEIVGKTAIIDLPAGGILTPAEFGEPVVAPGSVRLGLRLEAGRLPGSAIEPGASVLLVPVGRDGGEAPSGGSVPATIATTPRTQTDGSTTVDVTLSSDEGTRVAQLAAAGQLTVLRVPGSKR
jgi:hypothetical protein